MSKKVGSLDKETVSKILTNYEKDDKNVVVRHALARTPLLQLIHDNSSEEGIKMAFSLEVKTLPVANQKASGRCWIFAGLNLLREQIARKLHLKDFELSQNYLSLYDKIEKANFTMESIISLIDRDPDDRVFKHILSSPINDGGQWDMFVNLVKKYGLMPKNVFPETLHSENTRESNQLINAAIRNFASEAKKLHLAKKDAQIRVLKEKTMEKVYSFYLNAFGVPPKKFDFEYLDDKNVFHVVKGLTPLSFFEKYIGSSIDVYQSLINSPTKDKPFYKNYTVDYLGNVLEGKAINHLNVEMDRMKALIIAQLKDGRPVWFGSDVGFYRDRSYWAWDSNSLDYVTPFGIDIEFEKGDMLDFSHSAMNHAMLITGVNLVNGKPTRWKIENSWGSDNGKAGYYVMSASFFDKFVYQAVVDKKFLNTKEVKAAAGKPKHLNPWDPMGTLAD